MACNFFIDLTEFFIFIIYSVQNIPALVAGRYSTLLSYFVEPIDNGKPDKLWGDVDPATNKLTGDYGNKAIGAVKEKDSLITKNNGFVNILTFKGSPLGEIDRRDKMYASQ